ncbi:MAG: hydroxymethylbilane synthase [Andreesenia angusta]|nr:hydroxymethylbilane synthase [Andreesenia angusta]
MIVGTRRSLLAQAQADYVIDRIRSDLGYEAEKLLIETLGDKRLDITIDKIGGKGVFIKEIEYSLLKRESHCAVHSMKDMPFELLDDFYLSAIPVREDTTDAFIGRDGISFDDLPKYARIGTSSIRRRALVKELRPDIEVVPVRGNIQTRIEKIESENLSGIILATAGLVRMNLENLITQKFNPESFIPAVGQGALGIETIKNSEYDLELRRLDNEIERLRIESERSFMRALDGNCHSPIGAYSIVENYDLYIIGMFELNGKLVKKDISGNLEDGLRLGRALADKIIRG